MSANRRTIYVKETITPENFEKKLHTVYKWVVERRVIKVIIKKRKCKRTDEMDIVLEAQQQIFRNLSPNIKIEVK